MQFLICQKHKKTQKAAHKVTTNTYVCMNRYCQQSFLTLCSACRNDHRDHSNKILTVEDISFLIDRLLKSPFKQLATYIDQAVGTMKKFKLIQQNKRKIETLEKQIYEQILSLVHFTESLIHEYAVCKKNITQFSDILLQIQSPQVFKEFSNTTSHYLSNLEYNFQKDKFQYGNQVIRERYQNRRKSYEKTKRKLQQVKEYSMKIIEVILANDDDDEEQQEDITYKKKMYEILKREIEETNVREVQKIQKSSQSRSRIKEDKQNGSSSDNPNSFSMVSQEENSKSTAATGNVSQKTQSVLSIQKSCQTSNQWLKTIEQSTKQSQVKIKKLQQSNAKSLNQLQNKISMLVKQKQAIKKQSSVLELKQKVKNQKILEIEAKLGQNKQKRQQKQKQKQIQLQKLIQIANWRRVVQGDVIC